MQCAKDSLKEAPDELKGLLLGFASAQMLCHPCSKLLIQRGTEEMMKAAKEGMMDVAAVKLWSVLMLLKEGFEVVFAENLQVSGAGVYCNETDYYRFEKCCIKR
jgi:hypothetical protein